LAGRAMVSVFVRDVAVAAVRRVGLAAYGAGLTTPASANRTTIVAVRFAQGRRPVQVSCRVVWGERVTSARPLGSGVAAAPGWVKLIIAAGCLGASPARRFSPYPNRGTRRTSDLREALGFSYRWGPPPNALWPGEAGTRSSEKLQRCASFAKEYFEVESDGPRAEANTVSWERELWKCGGFVPIVTRRL
jgi:hypothetical protein